MQAFTYVGKPCRIVFGAGKVASLADEVSQLGANRAIFCCTRGRRGDVESLAQRLGELSAGICDIAEMYVPEPVAEEGRRFAREAEADCLISYGGGTAIGLAKLIALELDIPLITVVTTYSGSETGQGQGMLVGNRRVAHQSPRMLPKTIIYDSDLTRGLPLSVAIPSGINAMAHAVGAFFAANANPLSSLMAEEGIRAMASALPRIADNPSDGEARDLALYGAWLCGTVRTTAGLVLHHKVCHMAGNTFDLPHSETHTIVLPHSTAYNRDFAPEAMARIARALGDENRDAPSAIYGLLQRIGAPTALKAIGMPEEGIKEVVDLILADPYPNPRPMERDALQAMLEDAWHGSPPSTT